MPLWTGRRLAYSTVQKTGAAAPHTFDQCRFTGTAPTDKNVKSFAQSNALTVEQATYNTWLLSKLQLKFHGIGRLHRENTKRMMTH
jgi:hypothetical protein